MAEQNDDATPASRPSSSGRYDLLQAVRGAACLWVLLLHSLNAYPREELPGALRCFSGFTTWGWLGVSVFFALSGWCIAERLSKGYRTGESGSHFAIERALRIYPTYWASLIAAVVLRLAALPFNTGHLSDSSPTGPLDWLGSVFLLSPYLGYKSFVLVSWSLVYELGFYLCAAVALAAARRGAARGRTLFVIGCLMCLPLRNLFGGRSPWLVLDLWPDFFSGVAAWWAVRKGAPLAGYAALALLSAATIAWPAYGGIGRLTAVGTSWILALAWRWDHRLVRIPFMRPLIWTGGISYSLYLIQIPLLSPFENLMRRWVPSSSQSFIVVWAGALALAVMGGWQLNRYVEMPVERWRKRAF